MHRGSIHQRHPKAPFTLMPCGINCYAVLAPVSKCYPPLMGRLPTCYSPVRHSSFQLSASTREERSVRLACIRHAASVRPEPGSNSQIKYLSHLSDWLVFHYWLTDFWCILLHHMSHSSLFSFQWSSLSLQDPRLLRQLLYSIKPN